MELHLYQVDAFADKAFDGNPAAICPLKEWLPAPVMQAIAAENNLSETAFFVQKGGVYELRWFTPETEVDLCGHATLATAHVLFHELNCTEPYLIFQTRSGELKVHKNGHELAMDFPAKIPVPCPPPAGLFAALKIDGGKTFEADDYMVIVEDEKVVAKLSPDFSLLQRVPKRGVIVTAPGKTFDFVSRWFGPNVGVNEDPVTGSAHTMLAPYWSERLKKKILSAQQGGKRKGQLTCEMKQDRVIISGRTVLFMKGIIHFNFPTTSNS